MDMPFGLEDRHILRWIPQRLHRHNRAGFASKFVFWRRKFAASSHLAPGNASGRYDRSRMVGTGSRAGLFALGAISLGSDKGATPFHGASANLRPTDCPRSVE
jgi:hypothetical protein